MVLGTGGWYLWHGSCNWCRGRVAWGQGLGPFPGYDLGAAGGSCGRWQVACPFPWHLSQGVEQAPPCP